MKEVGPWHQGSFSTKNPNRPGPHVITYRATLPVPQETIARVSGWLQAHRRDHDVRPWQRAATCWTQAILVLRWFTDNTDLAQLARDANISVASGYRYLHEAINVIAERGPDLAQVLQLMRERDEPFLCLDGTLIDIAACHAPNENGSDLWYCGKRKRHGANIQVLTDADGHPIWTSPVEPGSTHDITAAREHVLPALYPAAAAGLPTLADKGYTGAGIGIHVPTKGTHLDINNRCRNHLINASRAPAERAHALLKSSFKALRRITLCPQRIGHILTAALTLLNTNGGRW